MSEQVTMTVARLYEVRKTCRAILGDDYKPLMASYGAHIQEMSRHTKFNGNELAAAMHWVKDAQSEHAKPMVIMSILAAAVELLEPCHDRRS